MSIYLSIGVCGSVSCVRMHICMVLFEYMCICFMCLSFLFLLTTRGDVTGGAIEKVKRKANFLVVTSEEG